MSLLTKKPQTSKQFFLFILTMTLMSMIGIFSSDIYLPSMPLMAHDFNVNYSYIQKTITVYLCGLAIFQLFYGALADHYGRRKTLLSGIAIYIIASLGCVFSQSLTQLLICRFVQAIGACAGLVMGRTIIADLYDKKESLHIFSIVLPLITISPVVAPVIGGYVQHYLGWRYVMAFTVLFGGVLLLLVFTFIGETHKHKITSKLNIKSILCNNFRLFGVFDFIFHCLIVGCMYSNWFSYLANSSYIYKSFGLGASLIGYCYMSQSASSMCGSVVLKKLLKKQFSVECINIFSLCAIIIICVLMLFFSTHSLLWFLFLITAMTFFNGLLLPANISSAISSATQYDVTIGGTASGMVGFIQILSGAIGTVIVGFFAHCIRNTAIIFIIVALVALVLALIKRQYQTVRGE